MPDKILIVSGCDQRQIEFGKISAAINRCYALEHGYDFRFYEGKDFHFGKGIGLTSSEQQTEKQDALSRSPNWGKLTCISRHLDREYDYIMWIDADAFIMDHRWGLHHWFELASSPNNDFFLAPDAESLNVGVFVIRPTEFIKQLFQEWTLMGFRKNDYYNVGLSSQQPINNLEQAAFVQLYQSNWNNLMPKVRILEPRRVNAHLQSEYWGSPYLPYLQYVKGESLVLHLAGVKTEDRLKLIETHVRDCLVLK